jgi:hypothetical protein
VEAVNGANVFFSVVFAHPTRSHHTAVFGHPFNQDVQCRPVRFSLMYFPAFFNNASIKPSVDKKYLNLLISVVLVLFNF